MYPFELECVVRQQFAGGRSFFDDFFGNYRDVRVKRVSRPVTVRVKELPLQGRPAGFSGTVGRITMRTSVSTDSLAANEAITYKVTFQGTGNLKLIEAPDIHFPADFENFLNDCTAAMPLSAGTPPAPFATRIRYSFPCKVLCLPEAGVSLMISLEITGMSG